MAIAARVERNTVAGTTNDFLIATHLALRGSQREIGAALAHESLERFPRQPLADNPALARARRRWFRNHWPEYAQRLEGIAEVLDIDPDRDAAATDLPALPFTAACSVMWSPPAASDDRHARIARNFDFFTGSVLELVGLPTDAQPPMFSRPYVIETHPESGLATIVVTACDLSGCFEGINEAGLAIALLALEESATNAPLTTVQAGVDELQLPRMVLERCTTADEALTLLYETKQYNRLLPCHYLVADAQGNAFVWEREQHNVDRVTPAGDAPMCVTNHPLYRYPDVDQLPTDDELSAAAGMPVYRFNTYARMRMLTERAAHMPLSSADLADAVDEIAVDAEVPTARTIWRSLFDLDARTIEVEFFLGDEPDGRARRSPPRAFSLT